MNPVIFIELARAEVKLLPSFGDHTKLLTNTYKFPTHIVLGFCAADVIKDASVAVFTDVPSANGVWTLEIAVELADLLPSVDGMSESVLDVREKDGSTKKLCLSNRMSRLHFADKGRSYHVLLPRTEAWHGSAHVRSTEGDMLPAAEEQLRTMAAMQFVITGTSAENAFESSIIECLDDFLSAVNQVFRAVRDCWKGFTPVTRAMRRDSISGVYVLLVGDRKDGAARLALNASRIALHPELFEEGQSKRLRELLNGLNSVSDVDQLLGEAHSSYEDGEYEFAFLQAVISAEIATARTIRAECSNRGVSKAKLDDNRKEMTYSWALNIGLALCFSPDKRPKAELIAAMNAARTKRNHLMHEGIFTISREDLGRLLVDTRDYIAALRIAVA